MIIKTTHSQGHFPHQLALKMAAGLTILNLLICGSVRAAPASSPEAVGQSTKKECPVEKGHTYPDYQRFRAAAQIPSLRVLDKQTLQVGSINIDTTWQKPCSAHDTQVLTKELGLPLATTTNFLGRLVKQGHLSVQEVSNCFQIITVDYKYLFEKFSNPALSAKLPQQQAEAMKALETADIVQAWAILESLRPSPVVLKKNVVVLQ